MAKPLATFLEFTPPQNHSKLNHQVEDEFPLSLVLAPFNPPPKVFFEETKINQTRTKSINIQNPSSVQIPIVLDKLPDAASGLLISETKFTIEPCSQYTLVISWKAVKAESFRHVIHVKDERKNKKVSEIIITATCVSPVKKKGRFCGRISVPLRTKIISNKIVVTSPKVKTPRIPLKKKTPPNTTENTFIVPGKDFGLMHANLPITPRRQTLNVEEDKENTNPTICKTTPKKHHVSGFRETTMEPPPMFNTHRKRKVYTDAAPLEIEACFSENDENKQKSLRRSTYSLNSPGSNSLASIVQTSTLTTQAEGSTENHSLGHANKRICQDNQRSDRFSVDSLNGPELIDVSSGSSEVFSITRDSLEANDPHFKIRRSHSPSINLDIQPADNIACDLLETKSVFTRTASPLNMDLQPINNIPSQSYFGHIGQQKPLTSLTQSTQFESNTVHSPSLCATKTATKKQTKSRSNSFSPNWHTNEPNISPIDFSPSFDPKRCTYVKSNVCTPMLSTSFDFVLTTPSNRSYTIINDDDLQEKETSCDFKLKTPKIETPCKSAENRAKTNMVLNFSSPDIVDVLSIDETHVSSPWKSSSLQSIDENLVLKTPTIHTPNERSFKSENSAKKFPLSCNRPLVPDFHKSLNVNNDCCICEDIPDCIAMLPEELHFNSCKTRQNSTPNDDLAIQICASVTKISNSENSTMHCRSSVKNENSLLNESSAPPHFTSTFNKSLIKLENGLISSGSAAFVPSTSTVSEIREQAPVVKEKSSMLLEISPPKKFSAYKAPNNVPVSVTKQQKFKPSRVLAKTLTAKSVISPTLRVKRLVMTARKTDGSIPHRVSSSLTVKLGPSKLGSSKKAPKVIFNKIQHSSVPMSSSELKLAGEEKKILKEKSYTKRWTGVPMSSLKLKSPVLSDQVKLDEKSGSENSIYRNPEEYIKSLSQPADYLFLMSATSQTDPFIKNCLYYDEEWLDRQERDLMKWLNSLLTPPAELEADSAGHWRVDVAALWRKSQNHTKVELAPSKETVSSQYLTNNRLNVLRKAAASLFRSDDLAPIFSKLAVSINKKVLSVREDRDLHLDYGLQCKVLSLLMCYNPLWLRIGLETIYGRPIALHSNSDVVGLTTFIRKNLLSDAYLKKKHSHAQVPSLYLSSFRDEMKKFILRKFFMLIYFLDQAKMRKLIRHDPCLFVKNSPYKESRELIIEFAKDLIAGLGDITKYMRSFGYVLQHKQTFLDEFDYAVVSRQDLRDGVRLTRVMEIILNIHSLSQKLRTPAISRLQKVHNVDIALKALISAGYIIQGDIKSKDIVDGHREKTLSLLWQIIYKFQAPRYEKAALKLQNCWRKNSLRFAIQKRIRAKQLARQNQAATKIQALWKGVNTRVKLLALKTKLLQEKEIRMKAAIVIQRHWRGYFARKAFTNLKTAVSKIKKWYKQRKATNVLRKDFEQKRKAAAVIQQHFRAKKQMENDREYFHLLKSTVLKVQRIFRCNHAAKKCRKDYLELRDVTLLVQAKYRASKQMKIEREAFLTLKSKTIFVQQWYRAKIAGRHCHQEFIGLKTAVCYVQESFRKNRAMKIHRGRFLALRNAAITIQRRFKAIRAGKVQRQNYLALKIAAIVLQNHFRALRAMKTDHREFLKLRSAVVIIQTRFRANQVALKTRKDFIVLKKAALCIQMKYRAKKAMEAERTKFVELKHAVIIIERRWRAKKLAEKCRLQYLEFKHAAIVIQSKFRATKLMLNQREHYSLFKTSTVTIQRRFRAQKEMLKCRSQFLELRNAVLTVQSCFRAKIAGRKARTNFLALKNAAITIQRRWRSNRLMKERRNYFLKLRNAAIFVQHRFRAQKEMLKCRSYFLELRNAVLTVQSCFRAKIAGRKARTNFLALKNAAITIQRRWRSNRLMNEKRNYFLKLQNVAIFVQRRFRANRLTQKYRKNYTALKKAVEVVQGRFRANRAMKIQQKKYLALKSSAITIQTHYRANQTMQVHRSKFLILKAVTMAVQARFRANRLAKHTRNKFLELRQCTILIQQKFRANNAMVDCRSKFLQLKMAAIFVQRKFRAQKAMIKCRAEYQQLQIANRFIQDRFRANRAAKRTRQKFLEIKAYAIKIQQKFRAQREMRKCQAQYQALVKAATFVSTTFRKNRLAKKYRQEFLRQRSASIVIQRCFRAWMETKTQRKIYLEVRTSVVTIQQRFRANCMMKIQRGNFLSLKNNVIIVQRRVRANMIAKQLRQEFLALKTAAITIQTYLRATIAMRYDRAKFLLLKNAAFTIQQRYRANRLASKTAARYSALKSATLIIQQRWRATLKMRHQRSEYLAIRASVVLVQQKWRGSKLMKVEMLKFKKMKEEKVAILAERQVQQRRHQSAVKIQALWKGYRTRKQIKLSSSQKPKSLKIANVIEQQSQRGLTLMNRYENAMSQVLSSNADLHELIIAFMNLDTITYLSPKLCDELVENELIKIVYFHLQTANRSIPYQELCVAGLRTLINLARYHNTAEVLWKETLANKGIDTLLFFMKAYYEKNTTLFCHAATLLWLFADDPEKLPIILQNQQCARTLTSVFNYLHKKNLKSESKLKVKKPMLKVTPSKTADWGLGIQQKVFENALFCIINVCQKLQIPVNKK